ncbi:Uncharacterized protein OBRU01_05100 [Operophtera brumata]|uniref:Uncharacterized protein n=1 Tax=Operophtera brumata TaxID=104452 RepID=A0A0L7LCQ9_OPEBR|nr:Uncharacterized protein OBRU01_05100 [Operophtera brumata]
MCIPMYIPKSVEYREIPGAIPTFPPTQLTAEFNKWYPGNENAFDSKFPHVMVKPEPQDEPSCHHTSYATSAWTCVRILFYTSKRNVSFKEENKGHSRLMWNLDLIFSHTLITSFIFKGLFKLLSETRQKYVRPKSCSISEDASDPLIQALSESNLKPEDLKSFWKTFFNIATGREDMVVRTANIVHKGILSWPNPTAEKVFFLRNSSPASNSSSKTSLIVSMEHQSENMDQMGDGKQNEPSTIVENAPFCVEFDDQRWRQHLALLKPLGLAALLNTRCLCELAKQIGFNDAVADSYKVQDCLAVFRHLVPLPHMLAVLVSERAHQLQMLTQRNSLTAYCTAPLTRGISPSLSPLYLELPADSRQLYAPLSQPWADAPALHFHSTGAYKPPSLSLPADSRQLYAPLSQPWADAPALHFHSTGAYKPPSLSLPADSRQLYAPLSQPWADAPALHFHSTQEEVKDTEGYFDMQCNQAQSDMVELVERLERACIRFVHFSKENELRSRVFSEKMGLDNMTSSKALSMSAPGAINLEHTTRGSVATTHPSADSLLDEEEDEGAGSPADGCRSLSCLTDSTDHSAPAKLPRGIENIRPHIEQVDNVPLLVSLFTDCGASSVRAMIQIMQVLTYHTQHRVYNVPLLVSLFTDCGASSVRAMIQIMQVPTYHTQHRVYNVPLLVSLVAVEPLYPVLCQKMPPYKVPDTCMGPIDLARALNSVPCSLSMTRDADVSLFTLITMSRHFMMCVWNSTQFWMCSVCFIALIQMALFIFWCYACKFLPSVISILVLYWYTLRSFCEQISAATNSTACWLNNNPKHIQRRDVVRADVRNQRRARLDFGTKLGMNSPF